MKYKYLLLVAVTLFFGSAVSLADLKLPVKYFGNEGYYYYKVGSKDNLNAVAKKLGITVDEIIRYNPSADQGLMSKQLLFFPVDAYRSHAVTPKPGSAFHNEAVTHVVKRDETLYGIAKLYGVTVDQLAEANPQAVQGVRADDILTIPSNSAATAAEGTPGDGTLGQQGVIYHTIQPGESMYSVSRQYNTTIENLLKLNPGIYPNHFIEGDVIKIQPNVSREITVRQNVKQMIRYTVKKGDTYSSIAKRYGVTAQAIQQANPGKKRFKNGKVIYIPKENVQTTQMNSSHVSTQEMEQTYSPKIGEIYKDVHRLHNDNEINIAIVLPFQLHKATPPRQAFLYTDFYKGFLLAADSISKSVAKKININVFDTQHNLNVTDSLLALPQMKNMDVMIAPSEPKQLQRCNAFGKKNGVTVVNCFSSKNEDYANNPRVLQLNSPASYVAATVNNWIDKKFKDYIAIFLVDPAGSDNDVFPDIQRHVMASKKKYQMMTVNNRLDYATLTQQLDPGSNYLFIPTSPSIELLGKIAPAVKQAKEERYDCEISMLGFPEYLTYLNDYKTTLQSINTYVFSRFFMASESRRRNIERAFMNKFGEEMIHTTPKFGIMGFDLGEYIVRTLGSQDEINSATPYFDGVQMDVQLKRASNWGGLINTCVEIVHLNGTTITESVIK